MKIWVNRNTLKYKERKILESNKLKSILIQEIENKLGIQNLKSLSLDLRRGIINKSEVFIVIRDVLKNSFSVPGLKSNSEVRAKLFSNRILDTLEGLADIYELQQK
ncbi:MAG: hypothetical protein KAT05_14815 [Spirochaetes bacterium]|nr:hypothetical protein [Spirochaetota bacterium]